MSKLYCGENDGDDDNGKNNHNSIDNKVYLIFKAFIYLNLRTKLFNRAL